jgi:hypothetical protein
MTMSSGGAPDDLDKDHGRPAQQTALGDAQKPDAEPQPKGAENPAHGQQHRDGQPAERPPGIGPDQQVIEVVDNDIPVHRAAPG